MKQQKLTFLGISIFLSDPLELEIEVRDLRQETRIELDRSLGPDHFERFGRRKVTTDHEIGDDASGRSGSAKGTVHEGQTVASLAAGVKEVADGRKVSETI